MNALVKNLSRSFAILITLCWQTAAFGQLTANFTATPRSGCSPLVVFFNDHSTGNPTQWKWDLGNGVTSTLQNPSATYFNPGLYTIKLVVRNSAGADSLILTHFIIVNQNPVVDFSASDTSGCAPHRIQFTDNSVAGSGNIIAWQWDFGDGTISSQQSPSHVYTSAGNYNVTLKVTNSNGCVKTLTKSGHVLIGNSLVANFTSSQTSVCASPATVQFTNSSTGQGPLGYTWYFGDGGNSTASDPAHIYNSNGNYSVTLIASNAQGCRDTVTKTDLLHIGNLHAGFVAPDVVCTGASFTINNTSSPLPSGAQWSFGDNTGSADINPVKSFTGAGSYSIKLVSDFGSCKDSVSRQITVVAKPVAAFHATDSQFCKTPASVQFHSLASGATSLQWLFGDGSSSTLPDPVHSYSTPGDYTVRLIVTNASGCSDTLTKPNYIQIHKPHMAFTGLPQTGCAPMTISPSALVQSIQPVQTYLWNFGDGTTSNLAQPSHVYSAGTYTLSLTITTTGGCTDSLTAVGAVRLGNKPHANFGAMPAEVCSANPAHFIDSTTGNPDQWQWFFGDGLSSTDQNPAHVFGGLGYFSVTLIAWNNTCPDTIKKVDVVNILPPAAGFTVQHNCSNKMVKTFIDGSIGATSWHWDFGDGSSSSAQNPVHTYAVPGTYHVELTVSNGNCTSMNNMDVPVMDERAVLAVDRSAVCKGDAVQFSSPGITAANIINWHWDFGDGHTWGIANPPPHRYAVAGSYRAMLVITDKVGCMDTAYASVTVNGPSAHFYPAQQASCLIHNDIVFTDTSASDGVHPIVQWIWNYGDGVVDSSGSMPFHHSYSNADEYLVSLQVVDALGCRDSMKLVSPVVIAQPHAAFYSPDTLSCTNKMISFVNGSSGYSLQYQWSFGDNTSDASVNPSHAYATEGNYPVSLLVTDRYGCTDSVTRPNYIHVSFPLAHFTVSDSVGNCPPLLVHFTNYSTGYAQLLWDFGDGNTSTLQNPSHYYSFPGVYMARLIITSHGGCTDTAFQKITIKGPTGTISYTPLSGCNPLTVQFTAITQNTSSFVWDFSDGNVLPTASLGVSHVYTAPGEFVPKIILTDAAGCNVPIVGSDTIRVYGVRTDFSLDTASFCTAGTVHFNNNTVSNDFITGYAWDFGDGSFSALANPVHSYTAVGAYGVKLVVQTQNGCADSLLMPDAVRILQAPVVQISSSVEACVPALIPLSGVVITGVDAEISWQWDFGNGQTATGMHPSSQAFGQPGGYTVSVIATARNGCTDTATRSITIHPLPQTNAGGDTAVCRGSAVQLVATGANSYQWNASPSLSCLTCAAPLAAPADSSIYIVTGMTTYGCIKTDSVVVRVHQPFVLQVGEGDTICVGSSVRLRASGADLYSWTPSTGVQNPSGSTTTAMPATSTTYQVIGRDVHQCFADTGLIYIKVWPVPTVDAGADLQLAVGDAIQLHANGSSDVVSWQWNNGSSLSCTSCSTTLAKPKQTTTYTVSVKNGGGCTAKDEVTVFVTCNNGNLFVPNTFSPNGDGVNDRFFPSGKGINMIKSLRVFNRWGEVVFERNNFAANDVMSGWDGTFRGQVLPPDVYVYSCDVVCQNNEVLSFKGDVTLLR